MALRSLFSALFRRVPPVLYLPPPSLPVVLKRNLYFFKEISVYITVWISLWIMFITLKNEQIMKVTFPL